MHRQALLDKLNSGVTVICDRYAHSGVAFTAAKGIPGLDAAWCQAPDKGLPAPDVVFFLSLTPEQAADRGGYGSERYEEKHFQAKARRPAVLGGCFQAKECVRPSLDRLSHASARRERVHEHAPEAGERQRALEIPPRRSGSSLRR